MSAADLEELLIAHPFIGVEMQWEKMISDAFARLVTLDRGYAVMGAIALGIHAKPRFTTRVKLAFLDTPPAAWLETLSFAGYVESLDLERKEHTIWRHQYVDLSISVLSSGAAQSAIQHARAHNLFGSEILVAEARDLLWLYLESGESPESMSEAIELIANCHQVVDELRTDLVNSQSHLISTLDAWSEKGRLAKSSNYNDSVVTRLRLREGEKPNKV